MRDVEKEIVVNSCDKADRILSQKVSEDEFPLLFETVQYSEIFRKAAADTDIEISKSALRRAIDSTFLLSSHEMRFQNRYPVIWDALTALRPAAGQLQREYF